MTEQENAVIALRQHHGLRYFQIAWELGLIRDGDSFEKTMNAIERVQAIESGTISPTNEEQARLNDLIYDARENTFYVELLRSEKELTRTQRDAIAKYLRDLVAG